MNLNHNQTGYDFCGNIQTDAPVDSTSTGVVYNNIQQNNHPGTFTHRPAGQLREGNASMEKPDQVRGSCPRYHQRIMAQTSIDPLVKRENYAASLRKRRKDDIISSKRLQQQQQKAATITFRVMSANVRGLNSGKKQEALARLIEEHKTDLVNLQETKLTKRLWISKHQMTQTQLKRSGGCICASSLPGSKPIKALGQAIAWLMLEHQRVPIHVISVYVEPGNAEQAAKVYNQTHSIIRSLVQRTRHPRIVLSGDFNQERAKFDALAKQYSLSPALQEGTQTHTKGGALDQLYTNLDIISTELIQMDQRVTDHCAILAVLRFTRTEKDYVKDNDVPLRHQWRLKEAAASETTITRLLERANILAEPATEIVKSQVKPQKRVLRWYEAKHLNRPDNQQQMEVTSMMAETLDKSSWKETLKTLEQYHKDGSWKDFHALVRRLTKLKPGSSPVTGVIINDETIMDTKAVDQHIAEYYAKLYESSATLMSVDTEAHYPSTPFSQAEVEEAAASTNFKKGLGPDLFDGRALDKNPKLRQRVIEELASMLNSGTLPDYMREGRLVALSKKPDKSTVELDDIRPIVVRSHLTKIAEKAIKKRLEEKHPHILKTKPAQTGFKPGKGTGANIVRVLQQLHPNRKHGQGHKLLLLIDLKKAFDSIDKTKLFQILEKRFNNEDERWLVALIKQLHSQNVAQVGSQRIDMRRGVMQGSVLAPLLFNVYLEEGLLKCPTLGSKYELGLALAQNPCTL